MYWYRATGHVTCFDAAHFIYSHCFFLFFYSSQSVNCCLSASETALKLTVRRHFMICCVICPKNPLQHWKMLANFRLTSGGYLSQDCYIKLKMCIRKACLCQKECILYNIVCVLIRTWKKGLIACSFSSSFSNYLPLLWCNKVSCVITCE